MTDNTPSQLRILGIVAHPDDAEFTVAGSAALWISQGAHITYVIVTDGGAGSNDPNQRRAELVRIRQAEQSAACALLGVQEILFLDYPDGVLEPTLDLRRDLMRGLLRADAKLFTAISPGLAVTKIINDPQMASQTLGNVMISVIKDTMSLIFLLGYLLYLNWQLTLLSFISMPLLGFLLKRVQKRLSQVGQAQYESQ